MRYSNVDFSQINILKIIDQFYGKKKKINFEQLCRENNSNDKLSNNSEENNKNIYLFS